MEMVLLFLFWNFSNSLSYNLVKGSIKYARKENTSIKENVCPNTKIRSPAL